jgi:hypothetical protein
MDDGLQGEYVGIERTLDWIFNQTEGEPILAASAHENLFWDLAKLKRDRDVRLNSVMLVFLYNSIPQIRYERLSDSGRPGAAASTPLAWDALVNDLGHFVADISINTAGMTIEEVSLILKSLSDAQR